MSTASDVPSNDSRVLQAEIQAAVRSSLIGEVMRGLAHQINQPLTSIRLSAEMMLLQSGEELPKPVREELETIAANVSRVSAITAQMRTMAGTSNRLHRLLQPADICDGLYQLISGQVSGMNVQLDCQVPRDLPGILGDEVELYQTLLYLLENALEVLKASATADARIQLSVSRTGRCIRFNVADNGPGVPQDKRADLGNPFFTSKPVSGATGLGLHIARRIAHRHRGRIRLRRSFLGGACFALELPIADTAAGSS